MDWYRRWSAGHSLQVFPASMRLAPLTASRSIKPQGLSPEVANSQSLSSCRLMSRWETVRSKPRAVVCVKVVAAGRETGSPTSCLSSV
jgi:hypothetical protein